MSETPEERRRQELHWATHVRGWSDGFYLRPRRPPVDADLADVYEKAYSRGFDRSEGMRLLKAVAKDGTP